MREMDLARRGAAVVVLTLMLGVAACDDDPLDIDDTDVFATELLPLNGSGLQGRATLEVVEDEVFGAFVDAVGLAPDQPHPQHVHADADCPTAAMDADNDGLVDIQEGAPAYGPVLIPLDDDLSDSAMNTFPVGTPVVYQESVPVAALLNAVPDAEEPLALETRTVVLHGAFVLNGAIVPAGTSGAEYVATLPIACGEVVRVE